MHSTIKALNQSTLIYGLGKLLQRFTSFFLLPVFTAYLSPSEYGAMAMLAVLTLIAIPLFSLGISGGMGPLYFQSNDQKNRISCIWSAALLLGLSAFAMIAIAWLVPNVISALLLVPALYDEVVSVVLTSAAISVFTTPFMLRMQFEGMAKPYIISSVVGIFSSAIFSFVLVVYYQGGVYEIVFSQAVGNLVTLLISLSFLKNNTKIKVNLTLCRQLLSLSVPLMPSFIFLFVILNSGKYILQLEVGAHQVGIFSVGASIGNVIGFLISAFSTAWYPFFMSYTSKKEEAEILFGKITTFYFISFSFVCLMFFVWAKPITTVLIAPAFSTAWVVIGLTAISQFFLGLFSLALPPMYFRKRVYYVSVLQALAAVISIALAFPLVKLLGMLGAAFSLAFSTAILFLVTLKLNKRLFRKTLEIKYEPKKLLVFLSIVFFIATLSFLLPTSSSLCFQLVLACVLTAISALIFWFALSEEDEKDLKELLPKFKAN